MSVTRTRPSLKTSQYYGTKGFEGTSQLYGIEGLMGCPKGESIIKRYGFPDFLRKRLLVEFSPLTKSLKRTVLAPCNSYFL